MYYPAVLIYFCFIIIYTHIYLVSEGFYRHKQLKLVLCLLQRLSRKNKWQVKPKLAQQQQHTAIVFCKIWTMSRHMGGCACSWKDFQSMLCDCETQGVLRTCCLPLCGRYGQTGGRTLNAPHSCPTRITVSVSFIGTAISSIDIQDIHITCKNPHCIITQLYHIKHHQ